MEGYRKEYEHNRYNIQITKYEKMDTNQFVRDIQVTVYSTIKILIASMNPIQLSRASTSPLELFFQISGDFQKQYIHLILLFQSHRRWNFSMKQRKLLAQ